MSVPNIGIIVLNWNGFEDTRSCVESLLKLRGPASRIYVVDNGSTDGSVRRLVDEFGGKIVLITNSSNLLFAGGNNVGIRRALEDGCSHVLLLNNDTVVDEHLVAELVATVSATGAGIACPKIYYLDRPNVIWYAGGILNLRRAQIAHRGIREVEYGQFEENEETAWATGCALFASRQVFESIGLLDESFRLYAEDVDFCLRAREAGFAVVFAPGAHVWHKVSASIGGNLSCRKLVRKWNALRRLVEKHIPDRLQRFSALADFVLTEPLRVLNAAVRGRLK